jgi:hypothetical protein
MVCVIHSGRESGRDPARPERGPGTPAFCIGRSGRRNRIEKTSPGGNGGPSPARSCRHLPAFREGGSKPLGARRKVRSGVRFFLVFRGATQVPLLDKPRLKTDTPLVAVAWRFRNEPMAVRRLCRRIFVSEAFGADCGEGFEGLIEVLPGWCECNPRVHTPRLRHRNVVPRTASFSRGPHRCDCGAPVAGLRALRPVPVRKRRV